MHIANLPKPGKEHLYSPPNHTISIFPFIFTIYTLFEHVRNEFICFVLLFQYFESAFFYTLILKFQLQFPIKVMELDTYLRYWWYSDWTSNIFFLAFFNTFFMLFRTGDQIHPHLKQPKMNLIPLCMVGELVLSWKLCLLWIYKVIFIIELYLRTVEVLFIRIFCTVIDFLCIRKSYLL